MITSDTLPLAVGIILVLVFIVSSVLGVGQIVREARRGELSGWTLVRGVSAVIALIIGLAALVLTLGL